MLRGDPDFFGVDDFRAWPEHKRRGGFGVEYKPFIAGQVVILY